MNDRPLRLLIVDDDEASRKALAKVLSNSRVRVASVADAAAAIERLDQLAFDILVASPGPTGGEGLALIAQVRERWPEVAAILTLPIADHALAAEAHTAGAVDVLARPWENGVVAAAVARAGEIASLRRANARLRGEEVSRFDFTSIVAASEAMGRVVELAQEAAPSNAPVLLLGETGTGKELIAHAIHLRSPRAEGPFVAVRAGAVLEALLESELFGHERGAFAGAVERRQGSVELADGGTLFLEGVEALPPPLQSRLARLISERAFERMGAREALTASVRVIASTAHSMHALLRGKRLGAELLGRLNVFPIEIPPLRERVEDIAPLADLFVVRACAALGKRVPRLDEEARRLLEAHAWPGNAHELQNSVERAVLRLDGSVLAPRHLPGWLRGENGAEVDAAAGGERRLLALPQGGLRLDSLERDLLIQAMERARGNKSKAATLLGLTRATLRYRLEKHGLG